MSTQPLRLCGIFYVFEFSAFEFSVVEFSANSTNNFLSEQRLNLFGFEQNFHVVSLTPLME